MRKIKGKMVDESKDLEIQVETEWLDMSIREINLLVLSLKMNKWQDIEVVTKDD